MALGGGGWLFQNKKLPGTYINFISKVRAVTDIADRGYGTMPLILDWGPEDEVFTITAKDFQESSMKYFGYDYTSDKLKGLRDLFKNLKTGYFYRLSNDAEKATCAVATAKYTGIRGNDITIAITANVDEAGKFDVVTYIDIDGIKTVTDKQQAVSSWDDVIDNNYVSFTRNKDIAATAGMPLVGGTNGSAVTGLQYQKYIDAIEPYYFNCMGYAGTDTTVQDLLIQFVKRMRDNVGAKYQLVIYNKENVDYEGVISVKNAITDNGESPAAVVYWLTGAEASCAVNASCTNKTYDGDFTINTKYSQSELEKAIDTGMIIFHNVTDSVSGNIVGTVNILTDINTFTSFTKKKNEDFSLNQVIRVLDQIAIDVSRLFNKTYNGKEQNDADGRIALWGDIVALHKEYQRVRAIQNFKADDVPVPTQGESKTSVLSEYAVQPTCCMEKLYLTVLVA
ncbi:phage tail sheath subtilisin-like domain-containing protein [Pectinatus frisingensis]|uniref:phage tail sheath subtilisin-like domain-containing protein n=1 Tax=Pectinatus frisingensis TaxID=865 RepID=UPI003D802A16